MPAYEKLFRLDGRRAVVVGAGSGIGRECARALAAHGVEVICADRDAESAALTAQLADGSPYVLDVLDPSAVSLAAAELGDVDVLVFTAATNVRKRLLDYTQEEFDRVVGLNLAASFALVRASRRRTPPGNPASVNGESGGSPSGPLVGRCRGDQAVSVADLVGVRRLSDQGVARTAETSPPAPSSCCGGVSTGRP
ncbi:SDR family oxidoreductase [Micromonospora sp. NPDC005707]|uniref:SDR family NAD(P)-dependent oxidoreductase n=1 Tax=Micromonospora sp. NPDC005707 TaxID=3157050 RepID=UPI0033CE7EC4